MIKQQAEELAKYQEVEPKSNINSRNKTLEFNLEKLNIGSAHDSGLDVDLNSDDSKDVITDEFDDDDTDSYITLSDSSVITTAECEDFPSSNKIKNNRISVTSKVEKLSFNPILMEVYENNQNDSNNKNDSLGGNSSTELMNKNHIEKNLFCVENENVLSPKLIGNPELHQLPKTRRNVLQKSVRMFRKSKEHKSLIVKSKSEGNIKELIDKEPKPTLMQSLVRGFSSMNFRYSEQKPLEAEKPTSCFLSLGAEVSSLNENQKTVSKLRKQELQPKSLQYLSDQESPASLFSCFTLGTRPLMPNHRNVMRPRDIKVCIIVSSRKINELIRFNNSVNQLWCQSLRKNLFDDT